MKKIAYLGLDVHARNCVFGNMDDSGTFRGNLQFLTSEKNIVNALNCIKPKKNIWLLKKAPWPIGRLR